MTRRKVIVHVGSPKTGTSSMQDLLWTSRSSLAAEGVLYPAERPDEHFLAALDLMELQWGGLEGQAVGAWNRLAERALGWEGTIIVSHEILATATARQARRALSSLGHPDDSEVHVVLTARDLARQIPAEWQENVKHRRTVSYASFLEAIRDPVREGRLESWFWGVQETPDILRRWGSTLPPEHVHLVTVPPVSAPRDLLWQRFAGVLDIDAQRYVPTGVRSNPSLGVPETAFVRRVNARLNEGLLVNEDYRRLVREMLVHNTLSQHTDSPRLGLPDDVRRWALDLCTEWVEEVRQRGYHVVGDLAELVPHPPAAGGSFGADPDSPDEEQVAASATEAVVTVLREAARLEHDVGRLRHEVDRLGGELHAAHEELERSRGLWFRLKRRLVREAGSHRTVALGLAVYRRVRGRSSPSA